MCSTNSWKSLKRLLTYLTSGGASFSSLSIGGNDKSVDGEGLADVGLPWSFSWLFLQRTSNGNRSLESRSLCFSRCGKIKSQVFSCSIKSSFNNISLCLWFAWALSAEKIFWYDLLYNKLYNTLMETILLFLILLIWKFYMRYTMRNVGNTFIGVLVYFHSIFLAKCLWIFLNDFRIWHGVCWWRR